MMSRKHIGMHYALSSIGVGTGGGGGGGGGVARCAIAPPLFLEVAR